MTDHFANRDQLRKQLRRKRTVLYFKQTFDYDFQETRMKGFMERLALKRIKTAEDIIHNAVFDEDAEDLRFSAEQDQLDCYECGELGLQSDDDGVEKGEEDELGNDKEDEDGDGEPMRKKLKHEESDDTSAL